MPYKVFACLVVAVSLAQPYAVLAANQPKAERKATVITVTKPSNINLELYFNSNLEEYRKQNPHDALIQAILTNNLNEVKKSKQALNKPIFVCYNFINQGEKTPFARFELIATYLKLAIDKAVSLEKNKQAQNVSFQIIEELLKKGSNPNARIGLSIHERGKTSHVLYFEVAMGRALASQRVLELLFKYGMCATDELLYDINDTSLSKQEKFEAIKLVTRHMKLQENRKDC